VARASWIDERLWGRHQNRQLQSNFSNVKVSTNPPHDVAGRVQANLGTSGLVPMELGAVHTTTTLTKMATKRLEYRCWGCGELGHVRAKCPTNPSKPLSIAIVEFMPSGKGGARD